jgi:hypothetical protein
MMEQQLYLGTQHSLDPDTLRYGIPKSMFFPRGRRWRFKLRVGACLLAVLLFIQVSLVGCGGGGNAISPTQPRVTLNWTASTSVVAGYNVYRGSQSGGPYAQINGAPEAATNYVDSSVQAGQTYYYVVTAVNTSGEESASSNQVVAVVPVP